MLKRLLMVGVALLVSASAFAQPIAQGTITATNQFVTCELTSNRPSVVLQITGTFTGTLTFQGTATGTYVTLLVSNLTSGATATSTTSAAAFGVSNVGLTSVRVFGTSLVSGTATVTCQPGSAGSGGAGGGGGGGGSVTQGTVPWVVDGTGYTFPATQSGSWSVTAVQATAANLNATIIGTLGNNVGAAASNRLGTLPAVSQTAGAAIVAGRDAALNINAADGSLRIDGLLGADGAAATTNRVGVLPCITETGSLPTLTDGRNAPCYVNTNGALFVTPTSGSFATDQVFGTSTYTEATTTGPLAGSVRTDVPAALANTTNEIQPLSSSALGGLYVATASDPCGRLAKTVIPINISTATTTELTAALSGASNYYYVCSLFLGPTSAAQNFALVDDDSDNCASVTSGMAGGTTAGSGFNFAANGGARDGNGGFTVYKTNGTNRVICAVTSAAAQISGVMTVVAAP